jgi:thymidylate kinase
MSREKFDPKGVSKAGDIPVGKKVEKEISPDFEFKIARRLITVDAPDGSGKGAIAKVLFELFVKKYGKDKVLLICPTRFDQSDKARYFEERLKNRPEIPKDSVYHNIHFLAAMAENYRSLIKPALEGGKIVIADSSELRSLAFILDRGTLATIESTIKWLKSGVATQDILGGNRIMVEVSPEDCLANIDARDKRDYGDPKDIVEAQRRQECYGLATQVIRTLKTSEPQNWIMVSNPRVQTVDIAAYLNTLVSEKVIDRLKLD